MVATAVRGRDPVPGSAGGSSADVTEREHRDRIEEAAAIVAGWPGVWSELLAQHVARPDGRCSCCTRNQQGAPHWPCGPAAVALRARRLAAAARPRP
jgi:hypothetical protein